MIREKTLKSGNTFGARHWTDGYFIAPMMPDRLWYVSCPHCDQAVWIDELEVVEKLPIYVITDAKNDPYRRAWKAKRAGDYQMREFLQSGETNTEKEKYIRQDLWWAGNHKRRHSSTDFPQLLDEEVDNLLAYMKLLDKNDDHERVYMAEIHREMREFDQARELLNREFEGFAKELAYFIQWYADQEYAAVREMKYRDSK
ncbi:MAG: hypothetical protein U5K71_10280 [Gracilimonas sp.]|nr:hypothetical protein [Gracilimonas sp.]